MNNSNGNGWPAELWKEINDAVMAEVAKVRVAQKVFPTRAFDNDPTNVPNDVVNFDNFSIPEGDTKIFGEIHQSLSLTTTQVADDQAGASKVCKTLARLAARSVALREDGVLFGGTDSRQPEQVVVDGIESMGRGLLGAASPQDSDDDDSRRVSRPIVVSPPKRRRRDVLFGENVFTAVADGITKLISKGQAPPYALVLPQTVYANTFVPPGDQSLVTVNEMIVPLVEGGCYGTGTLPRDRGLLAALGGDPVMLYVGHEATTEYVRQEGRQVFFRVVERVQFVARDPRALVRLDFDFSQLEPKD